MFGKISQIDVLLPVDFSKVEFESGRNCGGVFPLEVVVLNGIHSGINYLLLMEEILRLLGCIDNGIFTTNLDSTDDSGIFEHSTG